MFKDAPEGQTNFDPVAECKGQIIARIEALATESPLRESDDFDEGRKSMKREVLEILESTNY